MRASNDSPTVGRRPQNRSRVLIVGAVIAVILLTTSISGIARAYTNYLWFDAVGYRSIWSGVLKAQLSLALIFTGLFFVLLLINLFIADRLAPTFRSLGPEEELLERWHEVVGPRTGAVRLLVAGVFAVIAGAGVAQKWQLWVLYRNRQPFDAIDPRSGRNVGFFVFELPFISWLVGWLFAAFIIITIVTGVAHYLNGGIRVQAPRQRVTPQVKAHLSVLLAVLAIIKAADYWVQTFELSLSTRGIVHGATFTDIEARLPATRLLILISLFAVALFIYNIRRRGWVLPVLAVGLWAFVAVIVGAIYPAFVQRFRVEPAESVKEELYITRNIEATRDALGLNKVAERSLAASDDLTREAAIEAGVLDTVRLLDPAIVNDTYQRLQADLSFYRFADELDVDRYEIDGKPTQVVLATRQLHLEGIPQSSWEGQHLVFTHGFGLAMSPVNKSNDGRPDFVVSEVPVQVDEERIDVELEQPRLYYSEGLGSYAIVGTDIDEVDAIDSEGDQITFRYDGTGGVAMSNYLRRAAFALRFQEVDPLISGFISNESRIIFERDVALRAKKLAPFLSLDSDPYPVIAEGRIKYVIDGYTTTSQYPYAQLVEDTQLDPGNDLPNRFNYIRNSVKIVIDGYDGAVDMYLMPDGSGNMDPIAAAYAQAFPALFSPIDEMSDELRDHLRYPEDLFRVQTAMWGPYHIEPDQPKQFYDQADEWAVAQDPGNDVSGANLESITSEDGRSTISREERIDPYYLQMKLPGENESDFLIQRSFVRRSANDERKELRAFMVGKSDRENYGQLEVFELPGGVDVDGPALVHTKIQGDPVIAPRLSLLDQRGSEVRLGNLILLPVNESILWIRPMYVQAEGQTSVPELQGVFAVYGDNVALEDTVEEALVQVLDSEEVRVSTEIPSSDDPPPAASDTPSTITTTPPAPPIELDELTGNETVSELSDIASKKLAEADRLLREEGDLGGYQQQVREVEELLRRMALQLESEEVPEQDGEA